MRKLFISSILTFLFLFADFNSVLAISDPRDDVNNKVGIGLLSPDSEIPEAAEMVNNNGDWGWVTLVIRKSERDLARWQFVFGSLNKNHLIPIVRIATDMDPRGFWQRPSDEDAQQWADFLSKLYWPTKNRYVQIYNEVNHANEWGGKVDGVDYSRELEKTIKYLKDKNSDFFVLNAPLDLAAPTTASSLDAGVFLETMANSGVLDKLDGWASHSYPNPNFSANPNQEGRLGIGGYLWELSEIKKFGASDIPVFITETGWKRSNSLDQQTIADYYKIAFEKVWNDKNIVAVTPFVFDYPDPLYAAFSFKTNGSVLGEKYHSYFSQIRDLPKEKGDPRREDLVSDFVLKMPPVIIKGFPEKGTVTFKNNGNYIWNVNEGTSLQVSSNNLRVQNILWERKEIYPGQIAEVKFKVEADNPGQGNINIKLIDEGIVLGEKDVAVKNETLLEWFFNFLKIFS